MDNPETDPVAPVHPVVHGGPEHNPKPPRQVTGSWLIESGFEDRFPTTITRVVARHRHLLQADVLSNEVALRADIIACGCCGRPWVIGLYLHGTTTPNMAGGMWDRDKRLAVAAAVYGIGAQAGLRNLIPPQR